MPKTSLTESLLALFAGRARAAAIYGDLTEMAATRGTLWFLAAYARTLFSLTWRIVFALAVADIARELMFNLANLYFHATPPAWRTTDGPYLLDHAGPLLACIMSTLWFALPFAAIRYGLRDRFVRLTFAVAVGTTIAFLFIPWASLACAFATLALAAATVFSRTWRKPLEVLLWTGTAGLSMGAVSTAVRTQFLSQHPAIARSLGSHPLAAYALVFSFQGSLLLIAMVCSRLHRLLLERPASTDRSIA